MLSVKLISRSADSVLQPLARCAVRHSSGPAARKLAGKEPSGGSSSSSSSQEKSGAGGQVTLNLSTQKIVNQLSALSASRKQPRLLKLCNEDFIKHKTIMNAWKLYKQKKDQKRETQLLLQYKSIYNAMEDLKATSPELFEAAGGEGPEFESHAEATSLNASKNFTKFPIEMRIPTDYPPNKPWIHSFKPKRQV